MIGFSCILLVSQVKTAVTSTLLLLLCAIGQLCLLSYYFPDSTINYPNTQIRANSHISPNHPTGMCPSFVGDLLVISNFMSSVAPSHLQQLTFSCKYSSTSTSSICIPFPKSFNMASHIFQKIFSIFYQQPKKKGYSVSTINGVFGDWETSTVEEVPPPYADSPEDKTCFQDEKSSPSPPFTSPRLQCCPHETLSFERLQEITDSLTIKNTGETIDALAPSCQHHRSRFDPAAKDAKHICESSPSLLKGSGIYALEGSKAPSHTPSVVLCFHWDLPFIHGIRGQVDSAAELQYFLGADGISLCPHKQISDSDVINAIYGFVKRPSGREILTSCNRCGTEINISSRMEGDDETCRVTTKRYLGRVEKANDPRWLAQCGV